jgi:hypothetical protein
MVGWLTSNVSGDFMPAGYDRLSVSTANLAVFRYEFSDASVLASNRGNELLIELLKYR